MSTNAYLQFVLVWHLVFVVYSHSHENANTRQQLDEPRKMSEPEVKDREELLDKLQSIWDSSKSGHYVDTEHLFEHIGEIKSLKPEDVIDPKMVAVWFHGLHDFNNDDQLDGLELLHAVKHDFAHKSDHYKDVPLESFMGIVDKEMKDMDRDDNGFISYPELSAYLDGDPSRISHVTPL